MREPLLPILASLVLLAAPGRAEVRTVGPAGSGADFTTIQAAIDAAVAGDVVLVDAGFYEDFTLNKPLLVVGAGAEETWVRPPLFGSTAVRVEGIGAGEVAAVSGMSANVAPIAYSPTILVEVEQCEGTVALHSLNVNAVTSVGGLFARDSERVLVHGSTVLGGGWSGPDWLSELFTLGAEDSRVWVSDSTIDLEGMFVTSHPILKDTLGLITTELHLATSELLGGNMIGVFSAGGFASNVGDGSLLSMRASECIGGDGSLAGEGGHAARIHGDSTVIVDAATTFEGGWNGDGTVQQSPASIQPGSQVIHDPARLPTVSASPPTVSAGDALILSFTGEPGATGALFASTQLGAGASFPGVDGEVFLDLSALVPLGVVSLDGSGNASLPLTVPALGLDPTLVTFQWLEIATSTASNAALVALL